jgi:hypothetical protein
VVFQVHGTKVQLHLSLPQSIFLTSGGDLHASFHSQIQTLSFGMDAGTGEAKTPKSRFDSLHELAKLRNSSFHDKSASENL